MPVIDRLPVPEPLRHITPGAPRPRPEQDPVDHLPVIGPPATPRRISGQQPPQALPLLITQIMTIQQIKHRTDLHDPAVKIHGTRPSAVFEVAVGAGSAAACVPEAALCGDPVVHAVASTASAAVVTTAASRILLTGHLHCCGHRQAPALTELNSDSTGGCSRQPQPLTGAEPRTFNLYGYRPDHGTGVSCPTGVVKADR